MQPVVLRMKQHGCKDMPSSLLCMMHALHPCDCLPVLARAFMYSATTAGLLAYRRDSTRDITSRGDEVLSSAKKAACLSTYREQQQHGQDPKRHGMMSTG